MNQPTQKKPKTAITPTRSENYAEWYQQVVRHADMAENSPVRGCMVIKPWGWGMWENIQRGLDGMFKETGHKNAYFPLFIPLSFLEKEAEHVDGFAKECAVVTHHRLEAGPDGKLVPAGELDEPLVIRPTSETIIGASFAKWIQSHRDLPLLINQWANVVRWEMRTRLFLRTTEFLWQEGHTAHATEKEAQDETMQMLDVYADFAENWLAMPVIRGEKTAGERFPGAVETWSIESMMQDKKALQAGTSHFLGQNFAKAQEIQFQDDEGNREFCWTTSWGVSTRLIGAAIMTHGDDDGMRCPPMVAPSHVVVQPVLHKAESKADVLEFCEKFIKDLKKTVYGGRPIDVEFDTRDIRGGEKTWQWIKRGVPIRLEVGPRDVAEASVFMARRDKGPKEKESVKASDFVARAPAILQEIQDSMLNEAKAFRATNTHEINSKDDFYDFFKDGNDEGSESGGGFALAHFNGSTDLEEKIKNDLAVTVRCIPLEGEKEQGECPFTGEPSKQRVVWAKSY